MANTKNTTDSNVDVAALQARIAELEAAQAAPVNRALEVTVEGNIETTRKPNGTVIVNSLPTDRTVA